MHAAERQMHAEEALRASSGTAAGGASRLRARAASAICGYGPRRRAARGGLPRRWPPRVLVQLIRECGRRFARAPRNPRRARRAAGRRGPAPSPDATRAAGQSSQPPGAIPKKYGEADGAARPAPSPRHAGLGHPPPQVVRLPAGTLRAHSAHSARPRKHARSSPKEPPPKRPYGFSPGGGASPSQPCPGAPSSGPPVRQSHPGRARATRHAAAGKKKRGMRMLPASDSDRAAGI